MAGSAVLITSTVGVLGGDVRCARSDVEGVTGMLSSLGKVVRPISDVAGAGVREALRVPQAMFQRLERMSAALERAAESAESHITVVTDLTESVTLLTKQLNELLEVLRPVTAAEHDIERVVSHLPHLSHLLHHRHHDDDQQPGAVTSAEVDPDDSGRATD